MPDRVELDVGKVLEGRALEHPEAVVCDFTLEEQNAALESQGMRSLSNSNFKPVLKDTVNYVVVVVIINEKDEVLMVQEAKESCYGKWYLPAGRVDKHETLYDAAVREALEETGLTVECKSLIRIEYASGIWARFVMIGEVIGGNLKTTAQADKESLQAKWVANLKDVTLRADDIIPVIDKAREYYKARRTSDVSWFRDQLVALKSHDKVLLRIVVVIKKKATNRVHVLISERTSLHLPVCEIHPSRPLHSTLRKFMVDLFGADVPQHKLHGVLSLEHDPKVGDGLCLTLLIAFRNPLEEVPIIGKCVWHETSKDLEEKLLRRVSSKNSTIELHVLR